MPARDDKSSQALGFLTVVEHAQHGLFGGYLLLNRLARPLEFHCTTPVRPSTAQRILFGSTLEAYLFGEQIAATLVAATAVKPRAVFTDCQAVLAASDHTDIPVLFIDGAAQDQRVGPAAAGPIEPVEIIHLGQFAFGMRAGASIDAAQSESLARAIEGWDMLEPFERIRGAIDEAQRSAA